MLVHGVNSDGEPLSSSYVVKEADHALSFDGIVSLTRQEFAADCDINTLMAQYEKSGALNSIAAQPQPMYIDMTSIPYDLREAMDILNEAQRGFMSLSARTRFEFDNDPIKFVAFAEDPANLEKLREWGLAPPEKVPDAPMRVEVINPPPPVEPAEKPA